MTGTFARSFGEMRAPSLLVTPNANPSLLGRVCALRDATEGVFLEAGTQLIEVAALLDTAKTAAFSLVQLARLGLMDQLRQEADSQLAAFEALATEFGESQSMVRSLKGSLGSLGIGMEDIRRSVATMRIVVLNARVTLATLHAQDQRLSNFTESGQVVVAETTSLLLQIERTMAEIRAAVSQTEAIVGRINNTMAAEVLSAFHALMEDVFVFESGVRAISARGADLSRRLQDLLDATSRAVAGLQIGDRTRQQLDHVAFILSHPEGDDAALQSLAAALFCDAARTHATMLEQLCSGVAAMTSGVTDLVETHLNGFLGAGISTVNAQTLVQDNAGLTQAIVSLHPLQEQANILGAAMADKFQAFRNLTAKGELVQQDTRQIGINAVLSCTRLGQNGASLKVIAEQLQAVSREVGERFIFIRGNLDAISKSGADINLGLERLVRLSIEVPERLTGSIGPMILTMVEHLEPVQRAVAQLHGRLSGLAFDFGPALHHSQMLGNLASQIETAARPARSALVSDAALAEIYAIFTIEQERAVFRRILPDRANTAANAAFAGLQNQVDDGFML